MDDGDTLLGKIIGGCLMALVGVFMTVWAFYWFSQVHP